MKIIKLFIVIFLFTTTAGFSQTFTLKSNDIGGQASKKQVHTYCGGENISPQLSWTNAPDSTKSFAITIHDKDAPTGSGWWHWVVFDIPGDKSELVANAGNIKLDLMPEGVIQATTDFGSFGYGGPCPPKGHGIHQYIVTVHALKVAKLGLDKNASPAKVGYYLNSTTIKKASIVMYHESL